MQALVRLSDRRVLQFGEAIGELLDDQDMEIVAEVVELTDEQQDAIRAAFESPEGVSAIHISATGAISHDPYVAPAPIPLSAQLQADVDALKAYVTSAQLDAFIALNRDATPAELTAAMKTTVRNVRGIARLLRRLYAELEEE